MRRSRVGIVIVSILLALGFLVTPASKNGRNLVRAGDSNNLVSDAAFIDTGLMSSSDIQTFLNARGGFLKDFSEGGRSAAQIIYDAAHGYNQASGTANDIVINAATGTVSPRVILVTLQKEQGLLTMPNRNDGSLRAAMGYGCPDSGGCNPTFAGFTNQVEWGAWQLRYNYEAAFKDEAWRTKWYGSQGFAAKPGYVGQAVSIDNQNITFANAATASLYRYTPHIQSFATLFNLYFVPYAHSFVNQNAYPSLANGDAYNFVVRVKNTGSATWQKGVVNLGTSHSRDRVPPFTRESNAGAASGWLSPNRITMQESSVAPGETATYSFWMRNDNMTPGMYREHFQLVADGTGWMEDYGIYWDVKVLNAVEAAAQQYTHQFMWEDAYPTLARGESYNFILTVRNTGRATWQKGSVNVGTDRDRDRITPFLRESGNGSASGWISPNRITMQEGSVAPGATATFSFWMQAPSNMTPGTYREYFRLVADGADTWMENYGIYWDVIVR